MIEIAVSVAAAYMSYYITQVCSPTQQTRKQTLVDKLERQGMQQGRHTGSLKRLMESRGLLLRAASW